MNHRAVFPTVIAVAMATTVAGCSEDLLADLQDAAVDANVDADMSCNTIFLNFESETLTGGPIDNSATNTTSILTGTQTVPAFRATHPDRGMKIQAVASQVAATLEPVGMRVVTTRPAGGEYAMVMMGGVATDVGLADGVAGTAPFRGCNLQVPNRITFSFEAAGVEAHTLIDSANIAIGSVLVSLGVPTSDDPQDCLCWAAPNCGGLTVPCTIGGATTPRYAQSPCGTGPTFDEPAVIAEALMCPLGDS